MRSTIYHLCNCKSLDNTYNNTFYFNNRMEQEKFFSKSVVYTVPEVQYHRINNAIVVPYYIDDLEFCNYAVTVQNNKMKMYFINSKEYLSDKSTKLYLQLDVIQTYLFEMDLTSIPSLIERTHVQQWASNGKPYRTFMNDDEDLETGECLIYDEYEIYDYNNKGLYIISSTDKLTAKNGGSSGGGDTGGNVINKNVSPNGFIFLKCYESFGPIPYNIGDGTNTIGYGVTELYQKEYYDRLTPRCTEEQASIVLLELIRNFSIPVYDALENNGADMTKLTQNEFDAFVSFAYNSGIYGLTSSQIFLDYCNNVSRETIYNKWLTTNIMVGSEFEEGLRDRRQKEANIFLKNEYYFKPIVNVETGNIVTDNEGKGYIPPELQISIQQKIIESARKHIGKPYVWGGNLPPIGNDNGTDCSGLCQWAYNDNGISISRTTYTQINEGIEISEPNLKIGDLVFSRFSSSNTPEHVYIYSGKINGQHYCIEAATEGIPIREISFVWGADFRARRIIN